MKKLFSLGLIASALMLGSCSSEEPVAAPGGDHNVTITLSLPSSVSTRAEYNENWGNGSTVDQISYAVYATGETTPLFFYDCHDTNKQSDPAVSAISDLKATLELQLVTGRTYDFIFWADKSNNSYYTLSADGTVTVNYDDVKTYNESRDAFFAKETFTISENMEKDVLLYRPFAQVNVGTSDYAAAKKAGISTDANLTTKVTLQTYNGLNLLTGEATGDLTEVVFEGTGVDDQHSFTVDAKVDADGNAIQYNYMHMDYILTGKTPNADEPTVADQELISAKVEIFDEAESTTKAINTFEVSNLPVQRNYRTNIFGQLLTTKATFDLEIKPDFTKPAYDNEIKAVELVKALKKGGEITVPEGETLDLSSIEGGAQIEIPDGTTLKVEGTVNVAKSQLMVKEGKVVVEGPGKITSTGADGNNALNVTNGATLVVNNLTVETEKNDGGASIYSEGGNLELNNVNVKASNWTVGAYGGTLKAENCNFTSDSNNKEGSYTYTLCARNGCKAELDNCNVTGIQGGINAQGEGSELTVRGGTYKTVALKDKDGKDIAGTAWHAAYASGKGVIKIYGGNFSTPVGQYGKAVFDGNEDDADYPLGHVELYGGKFSDKGGTNGTETPKPQTGYKWQQITGDEVYKWEVVAEQ